MLREKILSIPYHCVNVHTFPENKEHLVCSHGPLSERKKTWLKPESKVCPLGTYIIFTAMNCWVYFCIYLAFNNIQTLRIVKHS